MLQQCILIPLPEEEAASFFRTIKQLKEFCETLTRKDKTDRPSYVDDLGARKFLSGSEKPISRNTFNKLRREKGLKNVSPFEGRTLYKVSDLEAIISRDKSA